jgi:ribosomal protein L37AE/L43A
MAKKRPVVLSVTTHEILVPATNVTIEYEGAVDSVVARPVTSGLHSRQFERLYLCPKCGQEGAVEHYRLKAAGVALCPACNTVMKGGK